SPPSHRAPLLLRTHRAHSDVVSDLAVSPDGSLFASASLDSDVRVWSLPTGRPVAVLRGHRAGSALYLGFDGLCPFRLVTGDAEGVVRVWDVRGAAVKRGGCKGRPEYAEPPSKEEEGPAGDAGSEPGDDDEEEEEEGESQETVELPPLPAAGGAEEGGAPGIGEAQEEPGAFKPGTALDDGVILLGAVHTIDSSPVSHSTRHSSLHPSASPLSPRNPGPAASASASTTSSSSLNAVNSISFHPTRSEICVGFDDSLARVYSFPGDANVEAVDGTAPPPPPPGSPPKSSPRRRSSRFAASSSAAAAAAAAAPSPSWDSKSFKLLRSLSGHMSQIVFVGYSHLGSRIATTAQFDGAARVWTERSSKPSLVLKLAPSKSPPPSAPDDPGRWSGRYGGRGSRSRPKREYHACDACKWTCDDRRIVTSQTASEEDGKGAVESREQ
ncbi:hypothetical protein TeGR_g12223, partial [Tetraparma gracilis]